MRIMVEGRFGTGGRTSTQEAEAPGMDSLFTQDTEDLDLRSRIHISFRARDKTRTQQASAFRRKAEERLPVVLRQVRRAVQPLTRTAGSFGRTVARRGRRR